MQPDGPSPSAPDVEGGGLALGVEDGPAPSRSAPRRRWGRLLLRLVALVVVAGVAYVGITFVQVWRAAGHDGARPADAIVVLGAAQYDGRPSPALAGRLDHALELWRAGLAPYLVVTGGNQPGDRFTEATASATYLLERGVPDERILREVDGTTTWESLAAAARILRNRDLTSVVLVSDPYHARRLQGIADELDLEASVSPTDGHASFGSLARETAAVAVGQIVGYRRLLRLEGG